MQCTVTVITKPIKARLIGIDDSKVLLPYTQDIIDEFGTIRYSNGDQHKNKTEGEQHADALASMV